MNCNFKELNDVSLSEINGGFDIVESAGNFFGEIMANYMFKTAEKKLNRSRMVYLKKQGSYYKRK